MEKEILKFKIARKVITYEGYTSRRSKDLMEILAKLNVNEDTVIPTFRENIEDSDQFTDDYIMNEYRAAIKSNIERTQLNSISVKGKDKVEQPEYITNQKELLQDDTINNRTCELNGEVSNEEVSLVADNEMNLTTRERDDLNQFIEEILRKPIPDVGAYLRKDPKPRAEEVIDDTSMQLTARTSGKIQVYCQDERGGNTKLIYATPQMSFAEFAAIVEKKYGCPMAMSFYEGDDVIELDDDDVLASFLELCNNKRRNVKLNVKKSQHVNNEDYYSNNNSMYAVSVTSENRTLTKRERFQRAMVFSNGEISIELKKTYVEQISAIYCCAFSPSGEQFVTASRDRSVRLWNTKTGGCTVMKGGHNGFVLSCDFSPKGNRVVSSSDDRSIKVWNTTTFTKVATLKGHEDKVYCVQYNPTGEYIVSGSCDHTVRVWSAETHSKLITLKGHTLAVFSCGFGNTNKGKYIVSGSDDRLIKIWDWEAGREVRSLIGHIGTVWSVSYSHNDRFVVSASMDHELKLWDPNTGACIRTMSGHTSPIHHAIFSYDDKYIYSCARDWSVMVWRTDNGDRVETIVGHQSTVYHMNAQGTKLLTSSLDDTLKLWQIQRS